MERRLDRVTFVCFVDVGVPSFVCLRCPPPVHGNKLQINTHTTRAAKYPRGTPHADRFFPHKILRIFVDVTEYRPGRFLFLLRASVVLHVVEIAQNIKYPHTRPGRVFDFGQRSFTLCTTRKTTINTARARLFCLHATHRAASNFAGLWLAAPRQHTPFLGEIKYGSSIIQ